MKFVLTVRVQGEGTLEGEQRETTNLALEPELVPAEWPPKEEPLEADPLPLPLLLDPAPPLSSHSGAGGPLKGRIHASGGKCVERRK